MEQATTLSTSFAGSGVAPAERGRLDATLVKLGDLFALLQAGCDDADPATLLAQWRVDLELHFALEEADSNFGALLRERPSLAHVIAELRSEHSELLDEVDRVRPLANARARWPELASKTRELIERFRAHEHKETELLQESVLRDDGVGAD
jgi:hypothetical protein